MDKNINLANGITLFRLFLIIPIVYFLYFDWQVFAIVLYLLFAFLDILDGYIARKRETKFGKIFDFIADGIFGGVIGLILLIKGIIPWLFILLISFPAIIYVGNAFRTTLITKGTLVNSRWKSITGFLFYFTLFLFILNMPVTIFLAYLFLIYYYVASVKYFLEVNQLKKKYHSKSPAETLNTTL